MIERMSEAASGDAGADAPLRPGARPAGTMPEAQMDCAWSMRVLACLAGAPDCGERREVEAHLAACGICQRDAGVYRGVFERLRAVPPVAPPRDLAPGILARVRREHARPAVIRFFTAHRPLLATAAAAAAVLLLTGTWVVRHGGGPGTAGGTGTLAATASARAAEWLCRTQEPDGSWSIARWGGDPSYQTALTGLALMVLLEPGAAEPAPAARDAVARATGYLLSQQNAQGAFGPAFSGAAYNQGIVTLALARAGRVTGDARVAPALARAAAVIRERQFADGGWGYCGGLDSAPNLSITVWQVEALRQAARVTEVDGARDAIARGLRWIAGLGDERGAFGYRQPGDYPEGPDTLAVMGAMILLDEEYAAVLPPERREAIRARVERLAAQSAAREDFYGRFFLASALEKVERDAASGRLAALRDETIARQERAGDAAGSWAADDRWAGVGGRVYATAFGSLALR